MHRSRAEQRAWYGLDGDPPISAAHPGADDAITNSGAMAPGDSENAIRAYFVAHPQEWAELQGIARPLKNLRQQCDVDVAPAQIARLFDAIGLIAVALAATRSGFSTFC